MCLDVAPPVVYKAPALPAEGFPRLVPTLFTTFVSFAYSFGLLYLFKVYAFSLISDKSTSLQSILFNDLLRD